MSGPVVKGKHHSRRNCIFCTKAHKLIHRYPDVTPEQNIEENDAYDPEDECRFITEVCLPVASDWCAKHQRLTCRECNPDAKEVYECEFCKR